MTARDNAFSQLVLGLNLAEVLSNCSAMDSMSFALLDLASIATKGGTPVDLVCGPQTPRRIGIECQAKEGAKEGAMPGTVEVVRVDRVSGVKAS
jgi:hypothetical protein